MYVCVCVYITHTTHGHEGYVIDREIDEADKDNIGELRRTVIYGTGYYQWRDNLIASYEKVMGQKHIWGDSKRVVESSAELVCLLKRAKGKIGVSFVDFQEMADASEANEGERSLRLTARVRERRTNHEQGESTMIPRLHESS